MRFIKMDFFSGFSEKNQGLSVFRGHGPRACQEPRSRYTNQSVIAREGCFYHSRNWM